MRKLLMLLFLLSTNNMIIAQTPNFTNMPNPLADQERTVFAISGTSMNNVFAVGAGSVFAKYDGISWLVNSDLPSGSIFKMEIADFSGNVVGYATGENGVLCRYNGTVWELMGEYTPAKSMHGLLVLADNNVWFCGEYQHLLHYDGANVQTMWSSTDYYINLCDVQGKNSNDLWLAGFYWDGTTEAGHIYHFNGSNMEDKITVPNEQFFCLVPIDDQYFLVFGLRHVYMYNTVANSISTVYTIPYFMMSGVTQAYSVSDNKIIATNGESAIFNYFNQWSSENQYLWGNDAWSPPGDENHVFIGGNNGRIILWDGVISGMDENITTQVDIYPNPVKDNISIKKHSTCYEVIISIYNIQGKLLTQQNILNDMTEIDFSSLASGIYIIKMIGTNINITKKIIKE